MSNVTNYYKVCGVGLGRVRDCFPFSADDEVSEARAWAAACEHRDRFGAGTYAAIGQRRMRIAKWKASRAHHECTRVGETVDAVDWVEEAS